MLASLFKAPFKPLSARSYQLSPRDVGTQRTQNNTQSIQTYCTVLPSVNWQRTCIPHVCAPASVTRSSTVRPGKFSGLSKSAGTCTGKVKVFFCVCGVENHVTMLRVVQRASLTCRRSTASSQRETKSPARRAYVRACSPCYCCFVCASSVLSGFLARVATWSFCARCCLTTAR